MVDIEPTTLNHDEFLVTKRAPHKMPSRTNKYAKKKYSHIDSNEINNSKTSKKQSTVGFFSFSDFFPCCGCYLIVTRIILIECLIMFENYCCGDFFPSKWKKKKLEFNRHLNVGETNGAVRSFRSIARYKEKSQIINFDVMPSYLSFSHLWLKLL